MGKAEKVTALDDKRVVVSYDGDLAVATGSSRQEKRWKNRTLRWSELLARFRDSVRGGETHAEYMRLPKKRQDELKDVGGFVGGRLREGKRKNGYVEGRQLITLDADFAPADLMQELRDSFLVNACAVYSTRKHCTAKPRVRLIIPLDREVTPDEYEAIARKVADDINIEYFDDSTYQAARLMYWPSHSSDVDPVFDYIDGPFLSADDVLAEYPGGNWGDVSYWPMSSRTAELRKPTGPAADPLAKQNIVGVFCRTYTVTEAIRKFLPEVYVPTDKPDRWTYAAGSTAGGLVIYNDDRFAWSNHATDPAAGSSCNAFDLVRIHLFGELDDGQEEKPANRRPSWAAMAELMGSDPECVRTHDEEAAAKAVAGGYDGLTTTLAVSPYQFTDVIHEELLRACEQAGIAAHFEDYRPYYDEATRISRELGMYRQNYCGCRFSIAEGEATRAFIKQQRKAAKEAKRAAREAEEAARKEKAAEKQAYAEAQAKKRAILKAMREKS